VRKGKQQVQWWQSLRAGGWARWRPIAECLTSCWRRDGYLVEDADVERLSPLIHGHINLLGRYHFTNPDRNRGDQLRPLRDPRTAED